jgi:putative transposase
MLYPVFAQLISLLLDLFAIRCRSDRQKDLEILLLRRQLRILPRHHPTAPRVSPWEKLGLAVLAARFTGLGRGAKSQLNQVLPLFKPDTVLKWHRELVRRKWTFSSRPSSGRPSTVTCTP